MKTLSLLSLAASAALLPSVAMAQPTSTAGGGAGVSWGGGMRGGGMHMGGGMRGGHAGGGGVVGGGQWRGGGVVGGGQWRGGGFGGGVRMPHFRPGQGFPRRLTRGAFIHPFWFGPQFFISNWQGYGFADPGPDRRWVRYYDDAYLIDRGGRVVDAREGLDWDQYGERWETSDGVPSYYGRNEFQPGDEDYAWVEEQGAARYADARGGRYVDEDDDDGDRRRHHHRRGERRDDRRHHGGDERVVHGGAGGYGHGYAAGGGYGSGGYGYGGPMGPMPMGPGGPGMVYGGGNTVTQVYGGYGGYGMYAYPIVIETTTTTAGGGATYSEEIIEEVVQTRQRARRRARPCNCSRPRPPAGERG
jgi:hypothetical protein